MKIAIDKITNKIIGFADVDDTDMSYLADKANIKIIKGKMPDRIEACKWNGKKIIVDKTLKAELEKQDRKREIIDLKKSEILKEQEAQKVVEEEQVNIELEKQAVQKAIDEGLLNIDESLKKIIN